MKVISSILFSLSLFLLASCAEEEITEMSNPEEMAIAFFDALYNQRDVKKAASVCSPKLARIIMHYKSPEAVARHLFNMRFDEVIITPDDSGVKVREQFKDMAKITLYFEGTYHGDKLKDVKRVEMIQGKNGWYLDKILKDPF